MKYYAAKKMNGLARDTFFKLTQVIYSYETSGQQHILESGVVIWEENKGVFRALMMFFFFSYLGAGYTNVFILKIYWSLGFYTFQNVCYT